ncbi:MAG: hypothetical protein KKB20_18635 [Proteobacteria bacterium]|nr:hypothetical protein [Pseudomonadota bacterium]
MAENRFCLALTLANRAAAQWTEFNFNSFARVGDQWVGANENGLFVLGGPDDAGEPIAAWFEIFVDFLQTIRAKRMYFGLESSGALTLILTFDDRTAHARTFTLTPDQPGNRQNGTRIPIDRGDAGRYLRQRIANIEGADFSLDAIDIFLSPVGRQKAR